MKHLLALILTLTSTLVTANNDVSHRPPSFPHQGGKAVFVDFEEAVYDITYDLTEKTSTVSAKFKMNVVEAGYPVFDVVADPTMISINGIYAGSIPRATPNNETIVRVLNRVLPIGTYEMIVNSPLKNLVKYTSPGVKSAFWVSDLEDRQYLERYLPVNLEYDRVKMSFNIKFIGLTTKQHVFTNGKLSWTSADHAEIKFPPHFTMNSIYFHTTPEDSVDLLEASFKSRNGKNLPVQIYMAKSATSIKDLEDMKEQALSIFDGLERDFGPFPHQRITIYNANLSHMGLGGMEYAGATVTNKQSLSHELFHSYFGRAVSPANGNAGWIDEALAVWRDNGYYRMVSLNGSSSLASHPAYTRKTDTNAYSFGGRFIAFLDNKLAAQGGLKPYLNKLLQTRLFKPIFTDDFITDMEIFYGTGLRDVFNTYVFQRVTTSFEAKPHRKLSGKELDSIL